VERIGSLEFHILAGSQGIVCILWNTKSMSLVYQTLSSVCVISQLIPVHILTITSSK